MIKIQIIQRANYTRHLPVALTVGCVCRICTVPGAGRAMLTLAARICCLIGEKKNKNAYYGLQSIFKRESLLIFLIQLFVAFHFIFGISSRFTHFKNTERSVCKILQV